LKARNAFLTAAIATLIILATAVPAGIAAEKTGLAAQAGKFIGFAEVPPVQEPIVAGGTGAPDSPLIFNHPGSTEAADAVGANVAVYSSPGAATPSQTLINPTREGVQLTFEVKSRQGDWINVQIPKRPNESFGWVKASDVKLRTVTNHIIVELSKHRLSAWHGSQMLMETLVGVGKSVSPTPLGSFYVDISVRNPGGPYGKHMLSVAAYSNVLRNFGGGVGQIAIHGTNAVDSVGKDASNGCLRLTNDAVVKLATMAPTGTPVFIVA
jgi:lipoprotein-anchoring transpeptidase ErfK/SrfK